MVSDRREVYYDECIREAGPRYAEFDLLSSQIAVRLVHTYDVLHQVLSRYIADFGLSRSTFNILMLLRHGPPEGMQLHDLGELLLVSRANITGLIDHLEEKGCVRRVVDPNDRRARYAQITKKAEALLDELVPLHYRNIKTLLGDLTTKEKETLLDLLKKTGASLAVHSGECAKRKPAAFQASGSNER